MVKVKEGEDSVVCTVTVNFRPHHATDIGKRYISKPADEMEIGVQRFAVQEDDSIPQSSEMTEN